MTQSELAELVQLVRAVARQEIMPFFRKLAAHEVQVKTGPLDLVTIADEAAEAQLTMALLARYPSAVVVGEEATAKDPSLLDRIRDAELCFILDPIDGTANFAAGVPLFGTMLAAVRHGRTVAGIIHDPVGDDSAVALEGGGAWIEGRPEGPVPLRAAAAAPIETMAGAISWRFLPPALRWHVCAKLPRLGAAWDYRCAAHQYRMLAAGSCHFNIFYKVMPWDHAAGVLIHLEAGGYAARLDGAPYSPAVAEGGLICAPDRASWQALHDALFGSD